MGMGIDSENPMDTGMGMGMTFENGYGCGYSYTRPEPAPRPSLVPLLSSKRNIVLGIVHKPTFNSFIFGFL